MFPVRYGPNYYNSNNRLVILRSRNMFPVRYGPNSYNSINRLVVLAETQYVSCEVRTEFL
jgi:hypothetical protein